MIVVVEVTKLSGSEVVVDFVARGPTPDQWMMVLVEEGPWSDIDAELRRLQSRLYGCLDAALDGGLSAKFPETKGKNILIRIDGYNLPSLEVREFFERFSNGVSKLPEYAGALEKRAYVASIDFELNLESIN